MLICTALIFQTPASHSARISLATSFLTPHVMRVPLLVELSPIRVLQPSFTSNTPSSLSTPISQSTISHAPFSTFQFKFDQPINNIPVNAEDDSLSDSDDFNDDLSVMMPNALNTSYHQFIKFDRDSVSPIPIDSSWFNESNGPQRPTLSQLATQSQLPHSPPSRRFDRLNNITNSAPRPIQTSREPSHPSPPTRTFASPFSMSTRTASIADQLSVSVLNSSSPAPHTLSWLARENRGLQQALTVLRDQTHANGRVWHTLNDMMHNEVGKSGDTTLESTVSSQILSSQLDTENDISNIVEKFTACRSHWQKMCQVEHAEAERSLAAVEVCFRVHHIY